MNKRLDAWISPFDPFTTIADAIAAAARIHLDGFTSGVLLPTLYDDYTQAQVNHTLGAELTVSSPEQAGQVRAVFEGQGVPCGGWSVPRGTGDIAEEGHAHGKMAAHFDYFVLNFEDGWAGFWTADGRSVVDLWLGAFWQGVLDEGGQAAVDRLNGNVGVTMVTNTAMMHAVSDDEAAAWTDGTNYDALEAYVLGDAGLDPDNSLAIWRARLARIGKPDRPVVVILEQGDLPALAAQHGIDGYGVQLWTLATAAQQAWPELSAEPAPAPEPAVAYPMDLPAVRRATNVDTLNQPRDPAALKQQGFDGVRFVMHDDDRCRAYARTCKAAGLVVLGVEAQESGGYVLPEDLVDVVQIGNEPDASGPSSWTRSVDDYAADLRIYRGTYPNHRMIAGGLASGNPDYLRQLVATGALQGYAAIGVHPYAKTAAEARALLEQYRQLTSLPIVVSEWNRPATEIGDFLAMLGDETVQAYWFCDGDWMVAGFGLLDASGQPKPELAALLGHAQTAPTPTPIPAPTPTPPATDPRVISLQTELEQLQARIANAQRDLAA